MLEATGRAMAFLRQKQILHRLGVVISIAVIGIACYVLYHMLRGIDTNEVLEAIKSTEPRQIMLAGLFVAAGYFTLTFYDLFAVRAIGHAHVPYRVNALAAFTSYSIGHNVGASVFTGGAVRYRIYSAWGLNAIDVAKICFLAGLTFWLGNAAVLGLGIASTLFAVALLASGLNSTVTATLAGQIVMQGFLDLKLPDWLQRLVTRGIAIIPVIVVAALYGESGTAQLLVFSQVVLSMQLPFAVIPLVRFVSDKRKMGAFAISMPVAVAAWIVAGLIVILNVKLLYDTLFGT